jgi:hypothetical protein
MDARVHGFAVLIVTNSEISSGESGRSTSLILKAHGPVKLRIIICDDASRFSKESP